MENDQQVVVDSVMARRLRVPVSWLREEAEAGNLPHVKAGDRFLFNPEAVLKILAERASLKAPAANDAEATDG